MECVCQTSAVMKRDPATEMTQDPALARRCALQGEYAPHLAEAPKVELWTGRNFSYRPNWAYHSGPNLGGGIRRFEAAS